MSKFPTLEHMNTALPKQEGVTGFIKETKLKAEAAVSDLLTKRGLTQEEGWAKLEIMTSPTGWLYMMKDVQDILLEVEIINGTATFMVYEDE